MVSMPMCLRFSRIIDNASYKIPQHSLRLCSFVSCKPQNSRFHNDTRRCEEHIRTPIRGANVPWQGYTPWRSNAPLRGSGILQDNSTWLSQKHMSTAPEGKNQTDQSQDQQSSANTTEKDSNHEEKIKHLALEVEQLTKKVDELTDKYKRALADGENLRQRFVKQIDDARQFGIQGFCKDLLEVADTLSKATECVPKNEVTDNNPHLKNLFEGLTMTEAELQKVFKKHGLVPVNPLDEKFDPNQHEALFQQEVEGKKPGTVVVVSKIGYKLHDRIVRPALVGVAKG